jgi:nifR3 family TIM-barrel protein
MNNFWEKLPKPFFVLAPMADVTDEAFRRIICKYGKPDVTWTEFVSADGLSSPGREVLIYDLKYTEQERPIVAQLFSSHPDKMRQAAKLCAELGFDGIDINMGCPDRSIEKQGAGAAMIKNPQSAAAIIQSVKDGIKDAKKNIPVSVKTRVGYNKIQIDEWIPFLLTQDIQALTIHARTRKEMSLVPARWEHVKEVVEIRNKMGLKTKIIGNGDVKDIEHAKKLAEETGCDGVMLGRAIFGNPWLFADARSIKDKTYNTISPVLSLATIMEEDKNKFWLHAQNNIPIEEKLKVLVEHTKLFEELLGKVKNFAIMKKHYKAYVNGFNGAKELRVKLMEAENTVDIEHIVSEYILNCS